MNKTYVGPALQGARALSQSKCLRKSRKNPIIEKYKL